MDWIKRHPLLSAMLLLLVVGVSTEVWLLQQARQDAQRAQFALEQKKQERDWLARQSPAPSDENQRAIEAELATATKIVAELRTALKGKEGDWLAKPTPAKPIDAYFDLANFVEKMRAQAARNQVMVKPDESFSFASHANEGPELDLLPAVFRQRLIVQRLLDDLLAARPRALLAVQRERPLTAAQRAARHAVAPVGNSTPPPASAPRKGDVPADFFEPDLRLSLRQPGVVGTEAFRVEFTGQTPALRAFLNSLATFKLPLIVREVTVESLSLVQPPSDPTSGSGEPTDAAPVPLVAQNLSKFTVVVEYVELPAPAEPTAR